MIRTRFQCLKFLLLFTFSKGSKRGKNNISRKNSFSFSRNIEATIHYINCCRIIPSTINQFIRCFVFALGELLNYTDGSQFALKSD